MILPTLILIVTSYCVVLAAQWLISRLVRRIKRQRAKQCPRCFKVVAPWFIEHVPHGGVFGEACESWCYNCSHGWPYPVNGENEDQYSTRLSAWRRTLGSHES